MRDPDPLPCTPHSCPRLVASLAPTAFTRSRSLSKLIASLRPTLRALRNVVDFQVTTDDVDDDISCATVYMRMLCKGSVYGHVL